MTTIQPQQWATKRAGRAPVVFEAQFSPVDVYEVDRVVGITHKWKANFGPMLVVAKDLANGDRRFTAWLDGEMLFTAFGEEPDATERFEKFLKALKRAVEGVP